MGNSSSESRPAAVRGPAVSDMFYPGDPKKLGDMVRQLLENTEFNDELPRAIISPHAGFIYSGPVAASAYAPFYHTGKQVRRILLLGPSHRVAFDGLALSGRSAYRTPLGDVPIDTEAVESLYRGDGITILDRAHEFEHSLEVQLPFLQVLFQDFKILPMVVGKARPSDVTKFMEPFLLDEDSLIVISSDLSHYNNYETARSRDRETANAIVNLDQNGIKQDDACGRTPIRAMIQLALEHEMSCKIVDLRSSGDTAGSTDQVVGYGAFHFFLP